ncbi:MAG: peptidylprolyl isomerase [Truepera sp.]|nr:peptidylprolyl isomerase [Truepera sp.]
MSCSPKVPLPHLLVLIPLAFVAVTLAQEEDPVVLRLGERVETLSEFDRRFEIAIRGVAASQGRPMDDEIRAQLARFRPAFLEQRVTDMVLLQEAEDRGIPFPEEFVERRVDEIRGGLQSDEDFLELIAAAGFGDEAYLRRLIGELEQIQQLITTLTDEIEISAEQLLDSYNTDPDRFATPEQVCARHILQDTVEEAQDTLIDLEAGADFETLAIDRSTGPSGPRGGDLGCFTRGRMVPPFEEAAFAAEVGTPVGPVETQFGFHTILVYRREGGGVTPFEAVRDQLEQEVLQERVDEIVRTLVSESGIESYPEVVSPPSE